MGFGIGFKEVGGLTTDQLALRVYVCHKRPEDLMRASQIVPASLDWSDLPSPVVVDVIECAPFRPALLNSQQRPIFPGLSAGHCTTGETGSIGAVVRAFNDNHRYVLGAGHVLAASGRARIQDPIIQPGGLDGGRCPAQTIAVLTDFVKFQSGPNFPNRADAALARLNPDVQVALGRLPVRRLANASDVRLNDVLFRIGCRTGERPVQIVDTRFATHIEFPTPTGGRANFGFRDLLQYRDVSQPGDSGGPILTRSGVLVGIHIARNVQQGLGLAVPVWSLPGNWNLQV